MKQILIFIGTSVIMYIVVLILLFAGGGDVFQNIFVSVGNKVFGKHWEHIKVEYSTDKNIVHSDIKSFRASTVVVKITNTNILLTNGQYAMGSVNFSSFNWGYLPLALIIILCIATPISFKRRLVNLVFGFTIVEIALLVFQWYIIWVYAEINNIGWYSYAPDTKQNLLLPILQALLVNGIGLTFTMPFIIWLLLLILRKDIKAIVPSIKLLNRE